MDLRSIGWLFAGTLIPTLVLSAVAGYAVRWWSQHRGFLDRPGDHRGHARPTPLGGGVAIWFAILIVLVGAEWLVTRIVVGHAAGGDAIFGDATVAWLTRHLPGLQLHGPELRRFLLAGTTLMLLGLVDDWRRLDWRWRLLVQTAVAAAVVLGMGWKFTLFIPLPWCAEFFSIVWIVALINAFNMLDNMDGLSAGVGVIAAVMLAAAVLLPPHAETSGPQLFVAGLLLVHAGALLGFLWHNWPPARLFMGDAGSYLIGFGLAVASILATYSGAGGTPRHAVLAPLCVMAVPLYDMLTVLWIRWRHGRSPFHADQNHFSHRLVQLGFSREQAVLIIGLLTATCGCGALLLNRVDTMGAIMVMVMEGCVLSLIAILEMGRGPRS